MFTVIIAENDYIEKVQEYKLFLEPLMQSDQVKLARWYPREQKLQDMLPELATLVGRRKEWRAVIICNEDGIDKQNPFDLVTQLPTPFQGVMRGASAEETRTGDGQEDKVTLSSQEYRDYLQSEHEKKLKAYEEAAQNPLTRLVTFFCESPTVTKADDSVLASEDVDYKRYLEASRRKQALRDAILEDQQMETAPPKEILCVAKRTYVSCEDEFNKVWSIHTETEYSRFYDRNMYFDRMRYLVFDILPKSQRDYMYHYIRFLYATILLASNEIPQGCLATERVYRLECENNEAALSRLLQTYAAKLDCTKELLTFKIREIREKKPIVLTDNEAKRMCDTRVEQTVIFDDSVQTHDLYANTLRIGLANGCQQNEEAMWDEEYYRSRKTLAKMLKQSRRALKRATTTARNQQDISENSALLLNEFQLEDVQDFVDAQELEMLRVDTLDLYDEEALYGKMEGADKKVRETIETRMFRKTTLALGGVACGVFLLGFFTVFLKNAAMNFFNFNTTLVLLAVLLGLFAVGAVVTLFFMRGKLVAGFRDYNDVVKGIDGKLHNAMARYTKYLTHVCNMRRGYAILNTAKRKERPDEYKTVLYMKHITDIENAKEAAKAVFGQFMVDSKAVKCEDVVPYEFDFDRANDYVYPLPYTEGTRRKITFIQSGVTVPVPVEFVKQIMVRREELYE